MFTEQTVAQIFHLDILPFMTRKWPNKDEREQWQIKEFIAAYKRLAHGRTLVCQSKREKPDYLLKDVVSGELFGVELTSTYLNDRSVPDEHMKTFEGFKDFPCDHTAMEQYKKRLADAVEDKSRKAEKGYQTDQPLILSVYANEYISMYMYKDVYQDFVQEYEHIFNNMAPFSEIVFWPITNTAGDGVLSVRSVPKLSVVFSWQSG
ncbi:MAG: hypothetical protein HN350_15385 [Phycisphaerales bacterium]|jgi:hypothetical protein|nr:hypothetical protein [Phycisphaerales bacterium]